MNYSLQEYANDVVYTLAESCRELDLPMPHIISESGRALTAHHALLLLSVIDVESQADNVMPELTDDDHTFLHEMAADHKAVSTRRVREVYHDATFAKEASQELFNSGVLTLRERALAEQIYIATISAVARLAQRDREEYADIIEDLKSRSHRSLLLQLLTLPVAARQLGDRPAFSDHADSPLLDTSQRGAARSRM